MESKEGKGRQRRWGEENHDYGNGGIIENVYGVDSGVDDGRKEEGEKEIGIWFPLLDLLYYDGKCGISPAEADAGYQEGGEGGQGRLGEEQHGNGDNNGVGKGNGVGGGLENS